MRDISKVDDALARTLLTLHDKVVRGKPGGISLLREELHVYVDASFELAQDMVGGLGEVLC